MDCLSVYLREVRRRGKRGVSAAHEAELATRIKAGDQVARNELVEANLPLAVCAAKRFRDSCLDFQDVIQIANETLMRAAELFDPTQGRFSTYAARAIYINVLRAIKYETYRQRGMSLESLSSEADEVSGAAIFPDRSCLDPAEIVELRDLHAWALNAINRLIPPRNAGIVRRCCEGDNRDQIASDHGICRQRVMQIYNAYLPRVVEATLRLAG